MNDTQLLAAYVISQTLGEAQAELLRLEKEAESWPAFDRGHAILKTFRAALGDPKPKEG